MSEETNINFSIPKLKTVVLHDYYGESIKHFLLNRNNPYYFECWSDVKLNITAATNQCSEELTTRIIEFV